MKLTSTQNRKNLALLVVLLLCSSIAVAQNCASAKRIVVIGSSTAAGTGASPVEKSWVQLFTSYTKGLHADSTVINLAVGGYTTYQALPTGTRNPSNRPAVDDSKNITAALSYTPDAIVVNLPSNDAANGYSLAETEANLQTIVTAASAGHVPIWITTSQPRNLDQSGKTLLMGLRDWINTAYGSHAIDFWTDVANSDGSIKRAYDSGDGIHLGNVGHSIFFKRVVASGLIKALCP